LVAGLFVERLRRIPDPGSVGAGRGGCQYITGHSLALLASAETPVYLPGLNHEE
jgi:hypothetical protein